MNKFVIKILHIKWLASEKFIPSTLAICLQWGGNGFVGVLDMHGSKKIVLIGLIVVFHTGMNFSWGFPGNKTRTSI